MDNKNQTVNELLRTFLATKLNGNSDDIQFRVGNFIQLEGGELGFEEIDEVNKFKKNYVQYVSTQINDFFGSNVPVSDIDALPGSTPVLFYIPYTPIDFYNKALDAIQAFSKSLVGTFYTLYEDVEHPENNINAVFNTDALTASAQPEYMQGKPRIPVQIMVHFKLGKKVYFGNQVIYKLRRYDTLVSEIIVPITRDRNKGKITETDQILSENESTNMIKESVWGTTLSFYWGTQSGVLDNVLLEVEDETFDQNTVYELEIIYPRAGFSFKKLVVIESGSIKDDIGDYILLTATFKIADAEIYRNIIVVGTYRISVLNGGGFSETTAKYYQIGEEVTYKVSKLIDPTVVYEEGILTMPNAEGITVDPLYDLIVELFSQLCSR